MVTGEVMYLRVSSRRANGSIEAEEMLGITLACTGNHRFLECRLNGKMFPKALNASSGYSG